MAGWAGATWLRPPLLHQPRQARFGDGLRPTTSDDVGMLSLLQMGEATALIHILALLGGAFSSSDARKSRKGLRCDNLVELGPARAVDSDEGPHSKR